MIVNIIGFFWGKRLWGEIGFKIKADVFKK
jgi:hypothetical protein